MNTTKPKISKPESYSVRELEFLFISKYLSSSQYQFIAKMQDQAEFSGQALAMTNHYNN
jgi:hypothetical protein